MKIPRNLIWLVVWIRFALESLPKPAGRTDPRGGRKELPRRARCPSSLSSCSPCWWTIGNWSEIKASLKAHGERARWTRWGIRSTHSCSWKSPYEGLIYGPFSRLSFLKFFEPCCGTCLWNWSWNRLSLKFFEPIPTPFFWNWE